MALSVEELLNLGIDDAEVSNVMKDLNSFLDDIAYKGFDPVEILKVLISHSQVAKKSRKEFKKDMILAITTHLTRGNITKKIMEKSSPSGQKIISDLKKVYKIVDQARNQGAKVVTLSRIASSFPELTIGIMDQISDDRLKRPMTIEEMRVISPDFPKVLMTSIAASIISHKSDYHDLIMKAIMLYCCYETRRIDVEMKDSSFKEVATKVEKYVNIAFMSNFISDDKRESIMNSDTILSSVYDHNGVITDEVRKAADTYNHKLINDW